MIITFLLISFIIFGVTSGQTVTTKLGRVKGIIKTLDDGTPVNLYKGLRYGESAAGERRFAPPVPVLPWNGTYEATKSRFACMQQPSGATGNNEVPSDAPYSEDCLFLNVWQPMEALTHKNLPVIFWIHGGGFESGTAFSMAYDARYMAAYGKVIVVTINYRLGSFGFLYGGTEDAPGNAGLLDQVLALKWVHDNIESFGGDPNLITIAGESAGGMSVGALILSPLTKGLFKRAIMQSGAPNSYLGSEAKEDSMVKTKDIATTLGCNQTTVPDMVKCLRGKSTKDILQYMERAVLNGMNSIPVYGEKFMPIKPSVALREGKFPNDIDLLFGTVHDEGSLFVLAFFHDLDPNHPLTVTVSQAKGYITVLLTLVKQKPELANAAGLFYTNGLKENNKEKIAQAIGASFGDFHITCPTILYGEAYAKSKKMNKAYAYRVSKSPSIPAITTCSGWMGVCHGDDVIFLFGFPIALRGVPFSEADYHLSKEMIHAWGTFAKTGKPPSMDKVHWDEAIDKTANNPSVKFMDLYPGKYEIIDNFYKNNCEGFWRTYLG